MAVSCNSQRSGRFPSPREAALGETFVRLTQEPLAGDNTLVLEQVPSQPDALGLLANCLLISGQTEAAAPIAERLVSVDPSRWHRSHPDARLAGVCAAVSAALAIPVSVVRLAAEICPVSRASSTASREGETKENPSPPIAAPAAAPPGPRSRARGASRRPGRPPRWSRGRTPGRLRAG